MFFAFRSPPDRCVFPARERACRTLLAEQSNAHHLARAVLDGLLARVSVEVRLGASSGRIGMWPPMKCHVDASTRRISRVTDRFWRRAVNRRPVHAMTPTKALQLHRGPLLQNTVGFERSSRDEPAVETAVGCVPPKKPHEGRRHLSVRCHLFGHLCFTANKGCHVAVPDLQDTVVDVER
jgi:hypothetical protein